MPHIIRFKCSVCPWAGKRNANASRCARCGGRLIRKEEALGLKKMQEAMEAAYDHLDRFGVVFQGSEQEQSQKRVFDLLRPFVKRPKAGSL